MVMETISNISKFRGVEFTHDLCESKCSPSSLDFNFRCSLYCFLLRSLSLLQTIRPKHAKFWVMLIHVNVRLKDIETVSCWVLRCWALECCALGCWALGCWVLRCWALGCWALRYWALRCWELWLSVVVLSVAILRHGMLSNEMLTN